MEIDRVEEKEVEDEASPLISIDQFVRSPINNLSRMHNKSTDRCSVCGDRHARMHYGVLTCFGCKGFFRRTLKRSTQYKCRQQGNCAVDKYERNSCRYCRFKRCLEVGMDPKVRPDRDVTGRHHLGRSRYPRLDGTEDAWDEVDIADDWSRRLPVEMRTTLMRLMNIEVMVNSGDTMASASEIYPLHYDSLIDVVCSEKLLEGHRTEIRYELYRRVENDELIAVAHRQMIAIIDWVQHLCNSFDLTIGIHDKLVLIQNGFAPLAVFGSASSTAKWTDERDVLCLCVMGCVSRNMQQSGNELYHLANGLVERLLDDLVEPLRNLKLTDEEAVLITAIMILDHKLRNLSRSASLQIAELCDRIQETLYQVVRETHPNKPPASRFGNLLLIIPTIMTLGNSMWTNLISRSHMNDQLLLELLQYHANPINQQEHRQQPSSSIFAHQNVEQHQPAGLLGDYLAKSMDGDRCRHASLSAQSSAGSVDEHRYRMKPSFSTSSMSSLNSQTSASISELELMCVDYGDDLNINLSAFGTMLDDQADLIVHIDDEESQPVQSSSSMSIAKQQRDLTESDPDYNVTLTPGMFTGLREAFTATQIVDNDISASQANRSDDTTAPAFLKGPRFFIGLPHQ